MTPYYKPTPSVKNRNNFFPQAEELGADEMTLSRYLYRRENSPWFARKTGYTRDACATVVSGPTAAERKLSVL